MTGQEYKAALARLGWSQAELGRRLGVHANTVINWGRDGPPGHVVEYLRVMELARQMLEPPRDPDRT